MKPMNKIKGLGMALAAVYRLGVMLVVVTNTAAKENTQRSNPRS